MKCISQICVPSGYEKLKYIWKERKFTTTPQGLRIIHNTTTFVKYINLPEHVNRP